MKLLRSVTQKKKNYKRTIIYDLTQGEKIDELNLLEEKLNADVAAEVSLPPLLAESQPDFLIILGENANF